MKFLLLGLFLVGSLHPISAAASGVDPEGFRQQREKAHIACIEKDSTTAGMTECTYKEYDVWDHKLNETYGELMLKLPTEGKQTLKAIQLEWIKYRDAQFKLIDQVYSKLQGTMYIPMRAQERVMVVQQQAIHLMKFLLLLEEL